MKNSHILELYARLSTDVGALSFTPPVESVYNPLRYAFDGFTQYLALCPDNPSVVFLGINPGPYGMAQTGIPFGEVNAVRNFLGITHINITPPASQHPSYPISGLSCSRSEVSGRRLWGLFREKFTTAEAFFRENIVLNYCPLLFLGKSNITPDKLAADDKAKLFALCDECFKNVIEELRPDVIVGVGAFAERRAREALSSTKGVKIVRILHPSPASPASNNDWAGKVTAQLKEQEVWR